MKLKHILILLAVLAGVVGCGGGGSGGLGGSFGALFMTDSLDGNDHVWITVQKVVLTGAGGNVTVFDVPAGKTIDLKTLHDASGERYSFLGTVPNGTYTGIAVTVDKTVTLFARGSDTGATRVFAGNNGSTAILNLTFGSARGFGRNANLALDFDLANWNDDGTTISGSPFLKEGQGNGLGDLDRQEHDSHWGTIQDLVGTAPDQSFNLVRGGRSVAVVTNEQTDLCNSEAVRPIELVNGQTVKVTGAFSVDLGAIVADSVRIRSRSEEEEEPEAEGPISNINADAGTFTITIDDAEHFQPSMTTVNIATNELTVFTSRAGVIVSGAEFFAALVDGTELQAVGEYDPETNTITAIRVSYEDEERETEGDTGG